MAVAVERPGAFREGGGRSVIWSETTLTYMLQHLFVAMVMMMVTVMKMVMVMVMVRWRARQKVVGDGERNGRWGWKSTVLLREAIVVCGDGTIPFVPPSSCLPESVVE